MGEIIKARNIEGGEVVLEVVEQLKNNIVKCVCLTLNIGLRRNSDAVAAGDRILWQRKIDDDGKLEYKPLLIENQPTFSLSLKSKEFRTVTFVSHEYFLKAGDKLSGISQKLLQAAGQGQQIRSVQEASRQAESAVAALRFFLRKHKAL